MLVTVTCRPSHFKKEIARKQKTADTLNLGFNVEPGVDAAA